MDQEQAEGKKNIVNTERYQYKKVVISDGRRKVHSKDNDDPLAQALRGKTLEQLLEVIDANQLAPKYRQYAVDKGFGHFRMILGQHLRYRWMRGEKVVVDGQTLPEYKISDKAA